MGMSITSAQVNLANAYEQNVLIEANLSKALKDLSKNPDLALMQVLMILGSESGGTMGAAENVVSQDAQKMNIMTALATYTKNMTNDVNTISDSSSTAAQKTAAATDLLKQCTDLGTALKSPNIPWKNPVTGVKESTPWISSDMVSKATSSLSSFMTRIGASGGAQSVVSTITGWINNPTSGTPTGQEQTQAMNKDLAIVSNLFQSLSTKAQNVVKEANTTLTQYQSNEGTLFTDFIALDRAIVAHLGGS